VGDIFQSESIVFGRVDGNMNPSRRKKVIDEFCNGNSMRVLLMTLGTGSVG
jgi:SNF2 family DNA or RNA helicase